MGDQIRWALARRGQLDGVEWYLARMGYLDPTDEEFGENALTRMLGMLVLSDPEREAEKARAWVSFVACPDELVDDAIPVASEEFWAWLNPNSRQYPPREGDLFIPYHGGRMTLAGVLRTNERRFGQGERCVTSFLRVERNGFTEMAWGLAYSFRDKIVFPFVTTMVRFWQFVGFAADLYQEHGLARPLRLSLNMKNTAGSVLSDLGRGWRDPFDETFGERHAPECLEPNVQIVRHLEGPGLDGSQVDDLVHEFAAAVDNAYGERRPRCYNHPDADPEEGLPAGNIRVWDV